ncbi:MAG: hypothetical protein J6K72_07060 [Clostridia bacterium]|nr:hypothetical protein [Clostridia bacterium]
MFSVLYLMLFLWGGVFLAWMLLPRVKPVLRVYLGVSLGVLLMMWLPVLWAYAVRFSFTAHWLAAGTLALLCVMGWVCRDRRDPLPFDDEQKKLLLSLAVMVIPLSILGGYLQYTHSIREAADGSYHVGQSTYGDLSLHLAVTTSIVNAPFPLENSLMPGATMAYPYLSDSIASSMYMMGMPLNTSMAFTGTLMLVLVFAGYALLADQLCRKKGAKYLAFFLLFLNGGLGFFHTLSADTGSGTVTVWDNLRNAMTGFYKTPTNQPDPYNLRWVNMICDMFVPQRGILGGWTMLMPCLNLLIPPLCRREKHSPRELVLLGLFAGGLPLIHTHSYLALVLFSLGACLYTVVTSPRGSRVQAFLPWVLYAAIAAALSLPQLICFTFQQATGSDHFLRFQFNWCNNRGGSGMVDTYFWFYIKNIGLPYLLILLAMFRPLPGSRQGKLARWLIGAMILVTGVLAYTLNVDLMGTATKSLNTVYSLLYALCIPLSYGLLLCLLLHRPREMEDEETRAVMQNRLIACGALLIYVIAEFILFQPNEYDNNKLLYVWFALCLPMAADYAVEMFHKLLGLPGRKVIAALFLFCCFASSSITVAREWVSDYQAYSRGDVKVAEFIKDNTPEHSVFVTGNHHLNPVSSLAGRTILLSTDSYLYYHGFNTYARKQEVRAFYEEPQTNLDVLRRYNAEYIYVSSYERNSSWFELNEDAIAQLFPLIYDDGDHRIYRVPKEVLQ